MARIKSLITQTEVDEAQRAHNCQASSKHRIERGQKRLKVKNGRSWDHYCVACAKQIIGKDKEKLNLLAKNFEIE
ncbi:MAG: hypothetical protein K6L75_05015 [Cellvibrionaceae bacterium]